MAIANVSTGAAFTGSGTTCTASLTVSGTDPVVVSNVWTWNAADTYVNTTYNGTTMSELGSRSADGSGSVMRLVGLANPSTGTNNVISSTSGSMQHWITCASYSGVDQSTPFPDTAVNGTGSNSTITTTMTTTVNNSWLVLHTRTPGVLPTAGTDTLRRKSNPDSGDSACLFDSDAARATGSNSLQFVRSPSGTYYYVMTSISPSATASGPANLKSLDTNVKANIKSYNTNVIANIKSINTNV